jgi:hypothetical protein
VRGDFKDSPFFDIYAQFYGNVYYFHDQFDNWIRIFFKETSTMFSYVSSLQNEYDERIEIQVNENFDGDSFGHVLKHVQLYLSEHLTSNNNVSQALRAFFLDKKKPFFLPNEDGTYNVREAIHDFLRIVKPKISPFLEELKLEEERKIQKAKKTNEKYKKIQKLANKKYKKVNKKNKKADGKGKKK